LVATLLMVAVLLVATEILDIDGTNSPLMTEGVLTVESVTASLPEHLATLGMFILAVAAARSWRRGRMTRPPSAGPTP
jgi:hypothetical protein